MPRSSSAQSQVPCIKSRRHSLTLRWKRTAVQAAACSVVAKPADRVVVFAGLALDYGSLGNTPLPQLLSTFVGGGVALADIPRPLWRLIESVIVPYVIEGALGTQAFPY